MKIVSFYTENSIYEKEVEDLRSSCEHLKLNFTIEKRASLGDWEQNCSQKPQFLLECLKRFHTPLLWVDADGIILKKPELSYLEHDIALYFNDRQTLHARNATIFLNPTKNTEEFLTLWCERLAEKNRIRPTPDQPVMIEILQEKKIPLKVADLPIEYMHIFDRDPIPFDRSVIVHFQASRTAKMAPLFWQHLKGSELKAMRMNARL